MTETTGYVDVQYLHTAAELLQPIKLRSYELMHLQAGQIVMDVGCGPGIDTTALARLVGKSGYVIGVDKDVEMLVKADVLAKNANLDAYVKHLKGDAVSLAFASGHFDSCRCERLFIHLPDPELALSEMVRVTKPGGWIVLVDTDWGTLSIDTSEVEVERRLARFRAEQQLNNGYSGRRLYRLLRRQALSDITLELFPIHLDDLTLTRYLTKQDEVEEGALLQGYVTQEMLERWRIDLLQINSVKGFFASLNMVLAAARRP
jgi:ubiquinone/menaquinone biosynthesis C-methylase UbiE